MGEMEVQIQNSGELFRTFHNLLKLSKSWYDYFVVLTINNKYLFFLHFHY